MLNNKMPVCCFLSLLSPLFLISPCHQERSRASPRMEIKEMGCLHRISFISFSIWWKGFFMALFCYESPFGLMASIAPASLVTCKVWSLDLYLKKLPVYMLLQNSIKHPCSIRAWVPVSFFLSLSAFLSFSFSLLLYLSISGWFPGTWKPAA